MNPTVDGRNPAITTWNVQIPVNGRINCQPQLVSRISEPSTVSLIWIKGMAISKGAPNQNGSFQKVQVDIDGGGGVFWGGQMWPNDLRFCQFFGVKDSDGTPVANSYLSRFGIWVVFQYRNHMKSWHALPESNSHFAPENLKIGLLPQKERIVSQPSIFKDYVSFREGILIYTIYNTMLTMLLWLLHYHCLIFQMFRIILKLGMTGSKSKDATLSMWAMKKSPTFHWILVG